MPAKVRWLLWAALHLSFVLLTALRSLCWALQQSPTFLPPSTNSLLKAGEGFLDRLTGETLEQGNPFHDLSLTYLHASGIETGYGFFAPNVPDNYKVVFELTYNDGQKQIVLPEVANAAMGLRLVNFLDNLSQYRDPGLHQLFAQVLAAATLRQHPGAISVRVVFGRAYLPNRETGYARRGESYEASTVYEFGFGSAQP